MFTNYLKIAFRNIIKQKGSSIINIVGLALGLACCIMVFLYVQVEFSYDNFHKQKDSIYRVIAEINGDDQYTVIPRTPFPLAPELINNYPEVINYTRYLGPLWGFRIQIDNNLFISNKAAIADSSFFNIFTFPFIQGDPNTALVNESSVVVTEKFAHKCFGNINVLGNTIRINENDKLITGIIKDIPQNSHLQFGFIMPLQYFVNRGMNIESWSNFSTATNYIQLNSSVDVEQFNSKIRNLVKNYDAESNAEIFLQPLDEIHLYSNFPMDVHMGMYNVNKGDIKNIYMLSAIAVIIMLLASINFTNLFTVLSSRRSKEIGVRKIVGSQKLDFIKQFYSEAALSIFLSLFFSLLLVYLLLPVFNQYTTSKLSLSGIFDLQLLLGMGVIILLTTLVSGSYPAIVLSSFKPVNILKNSTLFNTRKGYSLKTVLIVFQFSVSTILIIATSIFYNQLNYMENKDLGFNLDNTLVVVDGVLSRNHEAFKREIMQNPDIMGVTQSVGPYVYVRPSADIEWEGKDPDSDVSLYYCPTDYDYINTFEIEIIKGRFFSQAIVADSANYVLNETAAKLMGFEDPIGRRISYNGSEGEIVGVINDCHFESLKNDINPLIYRIDPTRRCFYIKVNKNENLAGTVEYLRQVRLNYEPVAPLNFYYEDEYLAEYTEAERNISQIFFYVSFIAIFIACLGLLGMSAFLAQQKTKEIGIRKVLGSTVKDIVFLLSKDLIKWIIAANIIAWPIAFYLSNSWLNDFAYRIEPGIFVFIIASVAIFLIAVLSVSYHYIKATVANPIDSIKYE